QAHEGEAEAAENTLNRGDDEAGGDARGYEVASLDEHGVAMLGIEGQNAADAADNLIGVAEEIKQGEEHDEKVEDECGDVAQDGADSLGEKTGLLLHSGLDHVEEVGVGVETRDVFRNPGPGFRNEGRLFPGEGVLHTAGNGNGFPDEERSDDDSGKNQKKRHCKCAKDGGAIRAETLQQPMVHGIKKDGENGGPAKRREKGFVNAENEIDEEQQDAVGQNRGQTVTR